MQIPLVDLALAALLVATCLYCWRLMRRLDAVKAGQGELARSIEAFDAATRRAQDTLDRLEIIRGGAGVGLAASMQRASDLATELSVMVGAGEDIARRIEATIDEVRAIGARKAEAEDRAMASVFRLQSDHLSEEAA